MEFRVLGPLEVRDNGVPVPLGGPKPRALLATLLLHAGSVVPVDHLVAAVWGADPPRDAVGALRAYVSRLRAVLPPLGDRDRLRYRAPGYELTVADGELDAVEFTRLLGEAREHASAADPGGALVLLDAALGLWRGEALADLGSTSLGTSAALARLADLRLVAAEERSEVMLRLGRGRDVVLDLEALVQRFPERERLACLLMRALYDCGRQAEALAVYRKLRRLLVAELGVEPSAPTQRLHRQLLAHDPLLDRAVRCGPTNLPRRTTSFVGRDREADRLATALRELPLVTLTGVGGVGKSRMAVEVAGRERARFADGVWLCELAPLPPGGPVSSAVAAALHVRRRHRLTLEETLAEYLRARELLLVLDNCEHVLDAAAGLVERLIPQCPRLVVLATSREALGVEGEQVWPLPPLAVADAATLFVQRARAGRPDYRPDYADTDAVADICRRLDALPLAIELAAARIRLMNAAELAQRLDEERLRVPGPRGAQPRHQSLGAAIDWSYRSLSAPEQRLFARLSVFAGSPDLDAVHGVCAEPGRTPADTLGLLTALIDKSLIVVLGGAVGTRFRMLETLRAYGRERLPRGGVLVRRHAAYFVDLAEQAARGVQGPDERTWVERTLPDGDDLRAAFEQVMADRNVEAALRLVTSLPEVSQVRTGYEAASWAERALALASPDHPLFAAAVGAAARGSWNVGDFPAARRLAALAGDRRPAPGSARTGYPADVAADVSLYEGDAGAALRHYAAEVAVARRDEDPVRLVWTLYYVAICHAVQRRPADGLPAAEECLAVAEATGNPTARSMGRYALGLVLKKSDPDRALGLFDEAAALSASVRNFWWQGIALMEAAATRSVHGDPVGAARGFLDVLDHWDRVGDWTQQWLNLRYVVRLLVRLRCEQDVAVLHACLLAAGKPSPLDAAAAGRLLDGPAGPVLRAATARGQTLAAAEAVTLARTALRRAG